MKILTLNAGSSSLKAGVYQQCDSRISKLGHGHLSGLGTPHILWTIDSEKKSHSKSIEIEENQNPPDLYTLYQSIIDELFKRFSLEEDHLIVSHRVVHGGQEFTSAVRVNKLTLSSLSELSCLAPLHQPYNLRLIEDMLDRYPKAINIASFDTMFHSTQCELQTSFALPKKYRDQGIRRYGFHGLSYAYLCDSLELKKAPKERVIALHLGAGSSACAMIGGQSVSTSMGFSAVEGIPMGTRTGQLDPGVILHLLRQGLTLDTIEQLIYKESGWLGLSGISSDMATLLSSDDTQAKFTVRYYCEHIAQEIGRLAMTMGGVDRLIFTAGIGEHSALIRQYVAERLVWLGAELDHVANHQNDFTISSESSSILINVHATDEEWMLARYGSDLVG